MPRIWFIGFLIMALIFAAIFAVMLWDEHINGMFKVREPEPYEPPANYSYMPKQHFRICGMSSLWVQYGSPTKIGDLASVNMESGNVAIYKVANIEKAAGHDWSYYDFEFVKYEKDTSETRWLTSIRTTQGDKPIIGADLWT